MSTRQSTIINPGAVPTHPAHLENVDGEDDIGGFRCRECGFTISIDPQSRVEYGHSRKPRNGGRCEHRPESVDPTSAWGRPNDD